MRNPEGARTEDEDGGDFELRADHVAEQTLREGTATTDFFTAVEVELLSRHLRLLVGPRGCGKTHMMRYAWLRCMDEASSPLAVYVSFNRYLRLEPLLKSNPDALQLFQSWVLARVLSALHETAQRLNGGNVHPQAAAALPDRARLQVVISRLERGIPLSAEERDDANDLSIDGMVDAIRACCSVFGRRRAVLLLDDAALTLTHEYLVEFFDIVRASMRTDVALKCSVYPGTTQYGPRFHVREEAQLVKVWLPVTDPNYLEVMGAIGRLRYPMGMEGLSESLKHYLMYAAFGVPRAYLSLLRAIAVSQPSQAAVNRAIQDLGSGQLTLYDSLEQKIPRLASVVRTGRAFFDTTVAVLKDANEALASGDEKQLLLGVEATDFTALTSRMVNLLIEAGLLFEHDDVKHGGPERRYRRFTPHLAALMANRAFSGRSRGESLAAVVAFIERKPAKHAVRRKLDTLLPGDVLRGLRLDLPPCQHCREPRRDDTSLFCHRCGTKLVDPSSFAQLMEYPIADVPNLSRWLKAKVQEHGVTTIHDLLAIQDPGTELRKIHRVGPRRAESVITSVEDYVDEFLS